MLGAEHPYTLTSLNNLAGALEGQGKAAEAEALHRQALAAKRRVLGDEHPNTLVSINRLGAVLLQQGKAIEAEPLLRQVGGRAVERVRSRGAVGGIRGAVGASGTGREGLGFEVDGLC